MSETSIITITLSDTAGGGSTSWNVSDMMMTWVRITNTSRRSRGQSCHYCRAEGEDVDNVMTMILKVCLIIYYFVTIIIIIIIITHREITISGVVPKCNSDNTTPDRAWSIERRSLFEAERVCSRCRRGRGSKYARFELHPTSGSKDMYNKLILFRVRVPPCTIHYWNYTRLVLPLVLPMFYWIVWCVADWFEWGNFCYYV